MQEIDNVYILYNFGSGKGNWEVKVVQTLVLEEETELEDS